MKRALAVVALSAAMISMSAGAASAHAVSVVTPSGQTHQQPVHAGDASLPPHTGAFKFHVTCSVNPTQAAATFTGPSSCN